MLNQTISENQQSELTELQTNLQTQYPQITKIDFDFGEYKEGMSQNELYRWGYWLKHCCRHLLGENLQIKFPAFKASAQIAVELNRGYQEATIKDLQQLLNNDTHQSQLAENRILKNQICKRIIRASNITRPQTETIWPYELADYHTLFQKWYPENCKQLDYFYQLLSQDITNITEFKTNVLAFLEILRDKTTAISIE